MSGFRNLAFVLSASAALLGTLDTAHAQNNTLMVSTSSITITAQVGSNPQAAPPVAVSTSGVDVQFAFAPNTAWLVVSAVNGSTASSTQPNSLIIEGNPGGLAQGQYFGTVTLTASGATNSPVVINVTFNVVGSTQLTASPSSLSFSAQTGGAAPATQSLTIGSSGSAISFNAQPSTTSGGNWLQITPTSGMTGQSSSVITVSVNPSGLAASTTPYSGTITVTPTGTGTGPLTVSVTLTVSPNPTLNIPTTALTFFYQTGTSLPLAQTVPLTSSGSQISFSVSATTQTGSNWLVVSPIGSLVTPQTLTIAVASTISGLPASTYTGTISISAPGAGNPSQTISVTLVVSATPLLTVSGPLATFNYQTGGANPANQTLQLSSTSTAVPFSVNTTFTAGQNWLTVGPASGTASAASPQTLTFSVNPANLTPGNYTATVTISSTGTSNTVTLPVTLIVSNGTQIYATVASLLFNFQTTQAAPPAQTFSAVSTGAPLTYTVATATNNCGNSWLSATPANGTTTGTVSVSVNTAGIAAPQTCTGTVTLSSPGAVNSAVISVMLNVSATALLNINPTILSFTAQATNPTPPVQNISLTTTDNTSVKFGASAAGGNWLTVGPGMGSTPANLTLSVNATGLSVGSYSETVTITSDALPVPQIVTVSLNVASNNTASVAPASLTFTQAQGGPAPAAQNLTITTSSGSLPFTAAYVSSPVNWLSVTPTSGNTPGTVAVSVNGALLSPATYTGTITFLTPGAASNPPPVQVTLTVGPPQTLTASVPSLSFSYQVGAASNPAAQNLTLTSTGGPASFTVSTATSAGGQWLSASPTSGLTGGTGNTATIAVSVNPQNLTPNTYNGTVTITSPVLAAPIQVGVSFVVSAMAAPAPTVIANAASNAVGPISPGEIITIYGSLLGPVKPASFTLNAQNQVAATLAGTQVQFDGVAGPILYTSASQINAIVPFGINGRTQTTVVISFNGTQSSPITLQVAPAAPGVFTASSTGTGQGSILNQDNTPNSSSAAAAKGSVVQIFATGGGVTNPGGTTGGVAPSSPLENLVAAPVVIIGGQQAQVTFAGSAPGEVEGVVQLNVLVPAGAPSGNNVPVIVAIGSAGTTAAVTMAIQ